MSYDVSFMPSPGREAPSIEALDDHFRERRNYSVEGGAAYYANEDTGVAFRFVYDEEQRSDPDSGAIRLAAVIEAPATRALELVEEVEALVRAFDLHVQDPTVSGMGTGPLDRDALVRGCVAASRFGYVVEIATSRLSDDTVMLYDDARLEAHWRWNRAHDVLEATTPDAFVPRVTLLAHRREVLASVAWLGDLPILLPEVDAITTLDTSGGEAWMKLVPIAAIEQFLAPLPVHPEPAPHRRLEPSPDLTAAVRAAEAIAPAPKSISPNAVLGRAFWTQTVADHEVWSGGKKIAVGGAKPKAKPKPKAAKPKPAAKPKAAKPKAAKPKPAKKPESP